MPGSTYSPASCFHAPPSTRPCPASYPPPGKPSERPPPCSQVKVEVAPPKDLAAVARAAHAIHVASEQARARTFAAGKELAADGEICDGYGRRISGKRLNLAAQRSSNVATRSAAREAGGATGFNLRAVPLRNVKTPLGKREDLAQEMRTPGSKEMRV